MTKPPVSVAPPEVPVSVVLTENPGSWSPESSGSCTHTSISTRVWADASVPPASEGHDDAPPSCILVGIKDDDPPLYISVGVKNDELPLCVSVDIEDDDPPQCVSRMTTCVCLSE